MPITEAEAIELALLRLCEILGEPVEHMPAGVALSLPDVGFDATARSGSHAFALNWKASGSPRHVHTGINQIAHGMPSSRPPLFPSWLCPT